MDSPDLTDQLGPKISEHCLSRASLLHALVIFGPLSALGGFWVFQGFTRYNLAGNETGGHDAVLVLGCGILLVVLVLLVKMLRDVRHRVVLYRDGFVSIRPSGTDVFRWDEIVSIRHREAGYDHNFVPVGTFRTFIIRRIDGKQVELNNHLTGVKLLGAAVLRSTFDRMQRVCWSAFQQGKPVSFGVVRMTREGIKVEGDILAWSKLRAVYMSDKRLCIKGQWLWNWREVSMLKVENSHVLLALVERILRERNSA